MSKTAWTDTLLTCVKYAVGASAAGSILLAGGLWYFQRKLIYPSYAPEGSRKGIPPRSYAGAMSSPENLVVPKPTAVGLPYEDVTLTTADGVRIKAYVIPARRRSIPLAELQEMSGLERRERGEQEVEDWAQEMGNEDAVSYARSRPTVVIFHANAGNMGHRIPLARKLNAEHKCNVFMLSYRGYGLSEGHASETGIRQDVESALEYITTHPLLGGTKLVVYGQSIGGAVALWCASRYPDTIRGIIIENTFLSLESLIPNIMPQLPKFLLPVLLTEQWDAGRTIPLVPSSTPILFLSGKRDALVPPSQMKALLELRGEGKSRWREFDGEHNDTCLLPEYWEEIGSWLREEVESDEGAGEKWEMVEGHGQEK